MGKHHTSSTTTIRVPNAFGRGQAALMRASRASRMAKHIDARQPHRADPHDNRVIGAEDEPAARRNTRNRGSHDQDGAVSENRRHYDAVGLSGGVADDGVDVGLGCFLPRPVRRCQIQRRNRKIGNQTGVQISSTIARLMSS